MIGINRLVYIDLITWCILLPYKMLLVIRSDIAVLRVNIRFVKNVCVCVCARARVCVRGGGVAHF